MHTKIDTTNKQHIAMKLNINHIAAAIALGCALGAQAGTIVIDRVITGTYSIPSGSTVTFKGNGKFKDCKITGANIKVVPGSTRTVFDNCTFACSIRDSELSATNFGAVPDMDSTLTTWSYQTGPKTTMRAQVYRYTGTDNGAALASMGAFCSYGSGITMHINGKFYTRINQQGSHNMITIDNADGVKFDGGTLLMGFKMWSCRNMTFSGITIVGETSPHDFPPIYSNADNYKVGSTWDKLWRSAGYTYQDGTWTNAALGEQFSLKYLYNLSKGLSMMGLGAEAIAVYANPKYLPSYNINVENCRISMRTSGVTSARDKSEHKWRSTHINVTGCHFDHIYYQPVGLHGGYNHIANCTAHYVSQAVDLSAYTNNTLVENFIATRCCIGPKQENTQATGDGSEQESYNNELRNCKFEITDDLYLPDIMYEMIWINKSREGDCFKLTNCDFSFTSRKKWFRGIMVLAPSAKFTGCHFTIDVKDPYINAKDASLKNTDADVCWLLNGYYHWTTAPNIELRDVTFTIKDGLRVHDAFKIFRDFNATGVTVEGNGTVDNYFSQIGAIDLNKSALATPCTAIVNTTGKTAALAGSGNVIRVKSTSAPLFPSGMTRQGQAFASANEVTPQAVKQQAEQQSAPQQRQQAKTSQAPAATQSATPSDDARNCAARLQKNAVTSEKWHF